MSSQLYNFIILMKKNDVGKIARLILRIYFIFVFLNMCWKDFSFVVLKNNLRLFNYVMTKNNQNRLKNVIKNEFSKIDRHS